MRRVRHCAGMLFEGQDRLMRLFVGVDGGQSGTTALIGDDSGQVLGHGNAGPCNHVATAEAEAKLARVVDQCVAAACDSAGVVRPKQFRAACFGMSGGPADKRGILGRVVPAEQWLITDDAVIALTGALGGKPGVITIAGTGSIALGRGADGKLVRAGGWGYVYGDEGSAFDIVRQALRACLRAEEGWGSATGLAQNLLAATGCKDINAVLHLFYTPEWPRSRIANLAITVDECGTEDDIARRILLNAAQNLSLIALSVKQQLWPEDSTTCSYIGGVFRSLPVLHHYRSLLELSGCTVTAPEFGPAAGALLEAYRLADVIPDQDKLLSSKFRHE